MDTIRRRSKDAIMGGGGARSKPGGRCKKHPKHRQSPGVCSLCLSERLSRLNNISSSSSSRARISTNTGSSDTSTTSSLSSYYSSSGSSCSSPMHFYRYRFGATTSTTKGTSMSFLLSSTGSINNVLKKSRSLVFPPRPIRGTTTANNNKERNVNDHKDHPKAGFWSKLIHPRVKRSTKETLMHSRTVRERSSSSVAERLH